MVESGVDTEDAPDGVVEAEVVEPDEGDMGRIRVAGSVVGLTLFVTSTEPLWLREGRKRMRRIGTPVILGALAALLVGAVAVATPSTGVSITELARAESIEPFVVDAQGDNDVIVLTATIDPGGTTGWHSHPGVEIAIVKAGTLTVYDANCAPRTVTAGHGRVQHAHTVHMGRNEGSDPVELYATFVVPHGSPVRVDEERPKGCSF